MPEKQFVTMTDPACQTRRGVDNIHWVQCVASAAWARRGGKGVNLYDKYGAATANSSTLAGFLEMDAVGVTNGHPDSVSAGNYLPVNFGANKTCVFPTSNRAAAVTDIGRTFDIVINPTATQCVNMSATALGVLRVVDIVDDEGKYVECMIPDTKRFGNL